MFILIKHVQPSQNAYWMVLVDIEKFQNISFFLSFASHSTFRKAHFGILLGVRHVRVCYYNEAFKN